MTSRMTLICLVHFLAKHMEYRFNGWIQKNEANAEKQHIIFQDTTEAKISP